MPFTFLAGGEAVGTVTTTESLAPGAALALALPWAPMTRNEWDVVVVPNGGQSALGDTVLCVRPAEAGVTLAMRDLPLYGGWNRRRCPCSPATPTWPSSSDRSRAPTRPFSATTAACSSTAWRGRRCLRWQRSPWAVATGFARRLSPCPTTRSRGRCHPSPRCAWPGIACPDHPVPLAAGWNLAGYLPVASLPITEALASIQGAYGGVLGFAGTAASYYPDLAAYNTLAELAPSTGFWISATQAITLQYPITAGLAITPAAQLPGILSPRYRLGLIRLAEQAAGVHPSYTWVNLYGARFFLPDGSPAPISTTVTALANSVLCGATVVTEAGRFGLLACYGDDVTTGEVDGAEEGAALTLLVDGQATALQALSFDGAPVAGGQAVTWSGLGHLWQVRAGNEPGGGCGAHRERGATRRGTAGGHHRYCYLLEQIQRVRGAQRVPAVLLPAPVAAVPGAALHRA